MSKRWGRVLAAVVNALTAPQHPWRRAHTRLRVANALFQRHEVPTRHGRIVLVTTHPHALEYPHDMMSREPETIDWIDGFSPPCVFWDVGANVGIYSLYAAQRTGVSVLAFEPAAASYAALCRNIEENGRAGRIEAFCVALGAVTELGKLNLSASNPGSVFNSFEGAGEGAATTRGKPAENGSRQSTIGISIDDFRRLFSLPPPNYLKIDVDGTEEEILAGAAETLANPPLRSVLVELDAAKTLRNDRIVELLAATGFDCSYRAPRPLGSSANAIFTRS